ncbi:MAG TPA: xanthine dehydrogenase family protein subunit M [Candidatus Limnocylindria bacterium]|nr:xanthine dehydrogenase family protein subunit M [Candidatus Limnocylindria bacterium]
MIPAAFDYVRAESVEDAIRLLREHGEDAKLLAGGHSLIPMMKLRLAAPATLIDIAGIPQLAAITVAGKRVTIGALTTHAVLAASEELRQDAPALWDAANQLGDPQVRNRGTIGGACAHGDPAADYPAVLQALEATFTLTGPDGQRELPAGEFFRGMFDTALGSAELLTRVAFDPAPHSAYVKYHHPASHYAVVGAAVVLTLEGDNIGSARVAVTGIGDAAFRARGVEQALAGVDVRDAAALRAACAGTASGVEARSDTFASGAYRAAMADVFVCRAIERAAAR